MGLVLLGVVHVEAPGLAATAEAPPVTLVGGAFVSTASSDGSLKRDDIRGSQNFVSEMARRYDGHR